MWLASENYLKRKKETYLLAGLECTDVVEVVKQAGSLNAMTAPLQKKRNSNKIGICLSPLSLCRNIMIHLSQGERSRDTKIEKWIQYKISLWVS